MTHIQHFYTLYRSLVYNCNHIKIYQCYLLLTLFILYKLKSPRYVILNIIIRFIFFYSWPYHKIKKNVFFFLDWPFFYFENSPQLLRLAVLRVRSSPLLSRHFKSSAEPNRWFWFLWISCIHLDEQLQGNGLSFKYLKQIATSENNLHRN